ncbi:hypothetical protein [Paenibacillus sp. LHD-38]|uniref:hypothetical protein n=1 Tax=Paenibacillus sp. LHD-38 TaxID=3072143 RepID=UPI0028106A64|nr:hypothetical protein [Paenibacillus sp. LHD-38]MDQ8735006.1 hypothetical protein [Paenibacillus sp. LHD-38]
MTTIGVLAVSILSSLLFALLDMDVFKENFGAALGKQSLNDNGWPTYLMIAAAFIMALFQDLRSLKRARIRKRSRLASSGRSAIGTSDGE